DNQYYNMFMSGGNGIYHEFTTDNENGQTLLVICDSYGASFVHFLLPHYEKVYIMDTRYYDREYLNNMTIDEFAKSISADEIATLLYMDSVAYTFNTEALYGLLK
ncbi:MAG TPA: DHHW family protein, partial [Clostridia bacterium]|nr:DHHW family protein [Clostridia bacterium]